MSVNAGERDRRVKLLERRDTSPKVGPAKVEWVEVGKAWAKIDTVKYLKAAIYKSVTVEGSCEVNMRLKEWLTAAHRIAFGGSVYAIVTISHDRRQSETLALLKTVDKLDVD